MLTIHRFHDRTAARLVCEEANKRSNIKLFVERMTDDDGGRVGKWAICAPAGVMLFTRESLYQIVVEATSAALAAELRKHSPHHPLANICHLRDGFTPYRAQLTTGVS